MPYQILSDDGNMQTVQLDDGSVVQVAKQGLSTPLPPSAVPPQLQSGMLSVPGSSQLASPGPAPVPFTPNYNTLQSSRESLINDPNVPIEGRLESLQKQKEDDKLKKASENEDLQSAADQYLKLQKFNQETGARAEPTPYQQYAFQKLIEPSPSQGPSQLDQITPGLPTKPQSKSFIDQMNEAFTNEQKGQAGMLQAQAAAEKQKAGAIDDILKAREQQMFAVQQRQRMEQQAVKEAQQKYSELQDKYLNTKIDPDRMWNSKSTGNKIFSALAIGLGALGSSLDGSHQNQALKIVEDQISRDMEAQRLDLEKKGRGVDMQSSTLGQLRAQFQDNRAADAAFMQMGLENAQLQLQKIAAQSKSPELLAQAKQMSGQLQQKKLVFQGQLESQYLENYLKANPALSPEQAQKASEAQSLNDDYKTLTSLSTNATKHLGIKNEDKVAYDQAAARIASSFAKTPEEQKAFIENYIPEAGTYFSNEGPAAANPKLRALAQKIQGVQAAGAPRGGMFQKPAGNVVPVQTTGFGKFVQLPNGHYMEVK